MNSWTGAQASSIQNLNQRNDPPFLDARSPGAHCIQAFEFMFDDLIGNDFGSGSEDCLHMNIYVPKSALRQEHRQLPVYVYFHGGAFLLGSNSDIDGAKIAYEQDIIIVIANYRLGVFGFWFSDQILHSENPTDSGNQGILDQQCAMKWVRDFIYYFGGEPSKVTIGGMSAGAQSIQTHLVVE